MWESRWIRIRNFGRNKLGVDFPWILCIKTAVLKMFSLYRLKILLDLNNLLVCSNLYLLKMMRRTCFRWLFIFFQVCYASAPPRDAAIVYVTVNDLALNNVPVFFEILFSMHFICVFQLAFKSRFLSNKTPRNFIDSVQANPRLFIFNFGKTSRISSFLLGLWKNEYLFFFSY